MKSRLHLFQGYGVELEYMIVDQATLAVKPIADAILRDADGQVTGELEQGITAWSNELVSHVIELKSNGPSDDLGGLHQKLIADVRAINTQLKAHDAMLMPGAAHPWMNPAKETRLWPHESQEIYQAYDRIFNCKGHGWSNLQSVHINFPFYDDEEFARLHTAIRFMMPMIPALTAASPILDGKFTGYMDKRLDYYERNQSKLPILTGRVVPEKLFTRHQYQKHVYDRIAEAIAPFDEAKILKPVWLNSRGAMARFDRGAIEIRIIDIQECVAADIAVVSLITELVKLLVSEKYVSFKTQESFTTEQLYHVLRLCVKRGSQAQVTDMDYVKAWGFESLTGGVFWQAMVERLRDVIAGGQRKETLKQLTERGTLAERIVSRLGVNYSQEDLVEVYRELCDCLAEDRLFTI